MDVRPFPHLAIERHCIALTRALRNLSVERLADRDARDSAYAAAGLVAGSDIDDAEALRRARLFLKNIAPARALGVAA